MSDMNTVAAYFSSTASAEAAIDALKAAGFESRQIGLAASSAPSHSHDDSTAYKAGQNVGGAWEKFKSMFTGNEAEPYAGEASREMFNDNVMTPPAYDQEDLHGSLSDLSVSAERGKYFGHHLSSNGDGVIVTVNPRGRQADAESILEDNGGDLGHAAASFEYKEPAAATAQNIQLYGEVLRVHKDRLNRGEVRIRKEVHTTTQTIEVPVTHEELVVERVPVSGQHAVAGAAFAGEEIRIPLSEERATVSKQAVVREEVRIGKQDVSSVKQLTEQVRSEELKFENDVPAESIR